MASLWKKMIVTFTIFIGLLLPVSHTARQNGPTRSHTLPGNLNTAIGRDPQGVNRNNRLGQNWQEQCPEDFREEVSRFSKDIADLKEEMAQLREGTESVLQYLFPRSCAEVNLQDKSLKEGVVTIRPPHQKPVKVLCEAGINSSGVGDGSGVSGTWTVVLNRMPTPLKHTAFNRSYDEYSKGFGDPAGEYYIGNDALHSLTTWRPHQLLVQLENFKNKKADVFYNLFTVAGAEDKYRLRVGEYRQKKDDGGDGLFYHDGMQFTTYDMDNDEADGNCAVRMGGGGGWWYKSCYHVLGTGVYRNSKGSRYGGVAYWPFGEVEESLKSFRMLIRPLEEE
ncbi:ficolin-2-like [Oratosquilla oratoria]|uniref:ficolin-2-like n=1 Tax=Oratosquilla oratoria TaxID=337810 RepID=UPI003F774F90